MKSQLYCAKLIVKTSTVKGYGVFSDQDIPNGALIEESYTLKTATHNEEFMNYFFNAGEESVISLGFGSIYNHSDNPNASYLYDKENGIMVYTAIAPIKKGQEIFIHYGKDWFKSRAMKIKKPSWRYYTRFAIRLSGRFMLVLTSIFLFVHFFKSA